MKKKESKREFEELRKGTNDVVNGLLPNSEDVWGCVGPILIFLLFAGIVAGIVTICFPD